MQAALQTFLPTMLFAALSLAQDKPAIHLDSGSEQMLASADMSFAMDAAQSGSAEIQLGKLAAQKATNPELKAFGRQMAGDHAELNDKLKTLLSPKHVTLPEVVTAADQAIYDQLNRLSGSTFDKACAEEVLKAHQTALKAFTHEAKNGSDSKIRNFASAALPMLQRHLDKIRAIHSQIRSS